MCLRNRFPLPSLNVTTASIHDSIKAIEMIESVRDHEYIPMDGAYDSFHIYDYVFENTDAFPSIDTNKGQGIVENNLTFNRKQRHNHKEERETKIQIEMGDKRTFSILEEILHCWNIWYVRNRNYRNYDVTIGGRIVVYNCIIMANQIMQRSKREIMDIVV